jgi:phosphoglycerol transferase MdoB-like AlkP superfamily enzyme
MDNQNQFKSNLISNPLRLMGVLILLIVLFAHRLIPQHIKESSLYLYTLWLLIILLIIFIGKQAYTGQYKIKTQSVILFLVGVTASLLIFLQTFI